jgi:hypothetical protein
MNIISPEDIEEELDLGLADSVLDGADETVAGDVTIKLIPMRIMNAVNVDLRVAGEAVDLEMVLKGLNGLSEHLTLVNLTAQLKGINGILGVLLEDVPVQEL